MARPATEEEEKAPWNVEILESQLKYVEGPDGIILKRLGRATGCDLQIRKEPNRRGGRKLKSISYGGQTQYLDDDAPQQEATVKIFIRGNPSKRILAAEVLQAVANGDDPEDHCARAEGAIVADHDIVEPDKAAWARWKLACVLYEHGARAHLTKDRVILHPLQPGCPLEEDAAEKALIAAAAVLTQAQALVEIVVAAKDELEPEDAPTHGAVVPFVEQYGVIVRVCDQDDNALSDSMKVRIVGPKEPAEDTAEVLRRVFIDGLATAAVLQARGQVQSMAESMAKDFAGDVKALEGEASVKVHTGQSALWITGEDGEAVAGAMTTLQEMLQFYLGGSCLLLQGLKPTLINQLFADEVVGVLTAEDSVLELDEIDGSAWVCGQRVAELKARIEELAKAPPPAEEEGGQPPPAKRRRTAALTVQSGTAG